MDRLNEQAALLALLRERTRGWSAIADSVEAAGSATAVLERELSQGQTDLLAQDVDEVLQERIAHIRADIQQWATRGVQLVTLLDPSYPAQLLTVHERPPFLFYRGRLNPEDATGVAIVGTRRATQRGLDQAAEIASGLARKQVPVISGLAAGIDTAAHTAALAEGGRTVAVIGTGLDHSYPPQNQQLQERIGREHLVLSQFWPDSGPTKKTFPMRNAIMSGYAAATVVVEAAYRSGARMQARMALQHGRPVLLLDTLLEHDWAQDYAAKPGTHVVHDADEVLAVLQEILNPPDELVWT